MPNRLADSTSPYLLQHADNPVDWWEWSEDAFAEARRRDVPVLLSVGYSACHWCHVMAHESFESPEIARVMNDRFVNIKVDREERPDVDSIYMEAVQAMTGRGGWPMTVWMTPDGRPFYAGTYFPVRPHHGMPAFSQVMDAIWHAWQNDRDKVLGQSEQMVQTISRSIPVGQAPSAAAIVGAVGSVIDSFDGEFGGFGRAPKFPQQPVLDFLLRTRTVDPKAIDATLNKTLHAMADGGIHDHLGGGFARYSVDREWRVPHFEKMLYDNAQLARIYLWAAVELGESRFERVARSTLDYLLDDMHDPAGGFHSAEDADSDGAEGAFYVWTPDEFQRVLGDHFEPAARYYGVTAEGNFDGANVLHLDPDREPPQNLSEVNRLLLSERNTRERPGRDDKVVAAWNGLVIRALAEAGAALNESRYLLAASKAAGFVLDNMFKEGRLQRSWRDGRTSGEGFVDDHAAMAVGLYLLYSATGETRWFEAAEDLVKSLDRFSRPEGGFYSTASDAPELIKRPQDFTDNPLPSGNALAAEALLISSRLTGDLAKRDRAVAAIASIGIIAERHPTMVAHHLSVARALEDDGREVAIVGEGRSALLNVYWSRYRPGMVLAQGAASTSVVPLLRGRETNPDRATAFVCRNFSCDLPTSDPSRLTEQLNTGAG